MATSGTKSKGICDSFKNPALKSDPLTEAATTRWVAKYEQAFKDRALGCQNPLAYIFIVDSGGKIVASAFGLYGQKGKKHAEEIALESLKNIKPSPNSKLKLIINQPPCTNCSKLLKEFAASKGLSFVHKPGNNISTNDIMLIQSYRNHPSPDALTEKTKNDWFRYFYDAFCKGLLACVNPLALVMVLDGSNKVIALSFGLFGQKGKMHSEEIALKALEGMLNKPDKKGKGVKLKVAINAHICSNCSKLLTKFAVQHKLQFNNNSQGDNLQKYDVLLFAKRIKGEKALKEISILQEVFMKITPAAHYNKSVYPTPSNSGHKGEVQHSILAEIFRETAF